MGSCAAPSAKGDDKFITTDYLQQCQSDRLLPKVVAMRAEGRSYRWIARELGISKNTVADIVQRHRANA
ncbi:helix-turn-helix domain-containing protein, partial [Escherichia coli]